MALEFVGRCSIGRIVNLDSGASISVVGRTVFESVLNDVQLFWSGIFIACIMEASWTS